MGGNNFNGFVHSLIAVRAEGLSIEKFINLCARNNISLYEVRRLQFTAIDFKMRSSDFKKLKGIVKKTSSKARILKKNGLGFLFAKIFKRKFFVFGITLFFIIILYFSNIIWSIDVIGTKNINKEIIYNSLKKYGLREGSIKSKLKLKKIEIELLSEIKELSIVNIKLQGTKARVEIVERTMPPDLIPLNKPTNIVALKDGIIIKVLPYIGQPIVQEGDYVKKGQILISGVITDKSNIPSKVVHSIGDIYAKTWYEVKEELDLNYKFEKRTGRLKKRVYYNIMGRKVCIKRASIDFPNYDKIEIKNVLKIGAFNTPIEILTECYYEKVFDSINLTKEEATELVVKKAEEEILKLLPSNPFILEKKIEKDVIGTRAIARVLYILREDIGVLEEIK